MKVWAIMEWDACHCGGCTMTLVHSLYATRELAEQHIEHNYMGCAEVEEWDVKEEGET